jgi:hypothetical protein
MFVTNLFKNVKLCKTSLGDTQRQRVYLVSSLYFVKKESHNEGWLLQTLCAMRDVAMSRRTLRQASWINFHFAYSVHCCEISHCITVSYQPNVLSLFIQTYLTSTCSGVITPSSGSTPVWRYLPVDTLNEDEQKLKRRVHWQITSNWFSPCRWSNSAETFWE